MNIVSVKSLLYDMTLNLFQNNLRVPFPSLDALVNFLRGPLENENNEGNFSFNLSIIRSYIPQEDAVYLVSGSYSYYVSLQLYNFFSLS